MPNGLAYLLQQQARNGSLLAASGSSMIDAVEAFGYTDRATNAYRRQVLQRYADEAAVKSVITAFGVFAMRDIYQNLLAQADASVRKEIKTFVSLTSGSITRNRETRLKRLHEEAAQDALRVMRIAYLNRSPRRDIASYRTNETGPNGRFVRYAGGKLEEALSSSNMYRVGRDGLDFIDPIWLDKKAAQWYRLNYGAGSRGKATVAPPQQKMIIFGQPITADFGLNRFNPSGPFVMPGGFWFGNNSIQDWSSKRNSDQFFWRGSKEANSLINQLIRDEREAKLGGTTRTNMTASMAARVKKRQPISLNRQVRKKPTGTLGIQGSRFLDAGTNRLMKTLPFFYQELFDEWFSEYKQTGGGPVAAEHVKGSTRTLDRAYEMAHKELLKLSSQDRLMALRPGGRFRR